MRGLRIIWAAVILAHCAMVGGETLPAPRRLNNLVVEVVNLSGTGAQGIRTIRFHLPGNSWIFLSARARAQGDGRVFLGADNEGVERGISLSAGEPYGERQLHLPGGEHLIEVHRAGTAELEEVILRRVPETGFSKLGATPRALSAGDHDWTFMAKHVLPHINTVIGYDLAEQIPFVRQWTARGGRWFAETSRPAVPEEILDRFGMRNPLIDGVFVDELGDGLRSVRDWTAALAELQEEGIAREKEIRIYYAGEGLRELDFVRTALATGTRVVWERYLGEWPGDAGLGALRRQLPDWMNELNKAVPGVLANSFVCVGHFSAPPLSLNRSGEINFKVWVDMQFHALATEPAFAGLPGVFGYSSRYSDRETMQWLGVLFRHYCVEGATNLLSERYGFEYRPGHIENPDFREGLKGWKIEPPNAPVAMRKVEKLGLWQGRFPYNVDWDQAVEIAPGKEPVRLRQTIRNLRPGRLYSAKWMSVRTSDIESSQSEARSHAIGSRITGATVLPERSYRQMVSAPASRPNAPFSVENPLWLDYGCTVFYADGPSAELVIEARESESGLLVNFVEVQAYLPN